MDIKSKDTTILKVIFKKKIVTIDTLSSLLNSSSKTARRRLKQWKAYTSYNENGRFYTLPDIPEFDANGLWNYRSIRFSKYGNLKQTITKLIKISKAGLDAAEIHDILETSIRSYLTSLQTHPDIKREKNQGRFIYFSAIEEEFINQKKCRIGMTRIVQLPKNIEAILILVETIKNPHLNFEALSLKLKEKDCYVTPESIKNLFSYHDLAVKKTPEVPF